MNRHILIDNLAVTIGSMVAGKNKFFSQSLVSETFTEKLELLHVVIPDITQEGTFNLDVEHNGVLYDPAFRVEKWLGREFPSIIYHHGSNEQPFDYRKTAKNTFKNIFLAARNQFKANLIVTRAPFHNQGLKSYQKKMSSLQHFMGMLSVAVKLNEAIIQSIRKRGSAPVITCGLSMGGWVTNLHRAYYNTSDIYIPIFSGAFLGELFTGSAYRSMTIATTPEQKETLHQLLNFNESFQKAGTQNVFPLMARHDQYIRYKTQRASYPDAPISVLESGHVTGALKSREIRNHILQVLEHSPIPKLAKHI